MELPPKKGFHRHHIIPKFLGGTDVADNLVYLTPYDHAQEHKKLFEEHGRKEDAGAYNMIMAQSVTKDFERLTTK